MQASQEELQRVQVVTETDVERAQSKTLQARAKLDDTEYRLSNTVQRERQLTQGLKSHRRIIKIRQLCDDWTTRIAAVVLLMSIPSMLVLVPCHAFGLPLFFWTIPLLCILSAAGFLGRWLFKPDDATLTLEMDSWERELGALEVQKRQTEAEVSKAEGQFNECYLKYQSVLKHFQSRINRLRSTDWRVLQAIPFENFLAEVFLEWGYEVETTKASGDQGVDLIISKDGIRIAIQAKGYLSSTVGNDAVQQAHTGMTIYRCHRCAVITNSTFTASARQAAAAVGCVLIDGESIPLLIDGQLRI